MRSRAVRVFVLTFGEHAHAVLHNALGHYETGTRQRAARGSAQDELHASGLVTTRAGRGRPSAAASPSWRLTRSSDCARRTQVARDRVGARHRGALRSAVERRKRSPRTSTARRFERLGHCRPCHRPCSRRICCTANGFAPDGGAPRRCARAQLRTGAGELRGKWAPRRFAPGAPKREAAGDRRGPPASETVETTDELNPARGEDRADGARRGFLTRTIANELFVSRKTGRVPPAQGLLKARDQHPPAARIRPPWDLSAPNPRGAGAGTGTRGLSDANAALARRHSHHVFKHGPGQLKGFPMTDRSTSLRWDVHVAPSEPLHATDPGCGRGGAVPGRRYRQR